MAPSERAPVVGTNTLIATPQARRPWIAAADARLEIWPPGPGDERRTRADLDPPVIARVDSAASLHEAFRCGMRALWATAALDPDDAIGALGRHDPGAQLVIEVGGVRGAGHAAGADSSANDLETELADLADLAVAHRVPGARLAMAISATPRVKLAALLEMWRADARLRRHPLVVAIPSATPRAARSGLVAVATIAGAAVATDDIRGARRVIEVLGAIAQRPGDPQRPSKGDLR